MDNKENSLNYLDDAVFDYYLTPTKKHKVRWVRIDWF